MVKFPVKRSCSREEIERFEYFKHLFKEHLGDVKEMLHCFDYPVTDMVFDFKVKGARSPSSITVRENYSMNMIEGEIAVPKVSAKSVEEKIGGIEIYGEKPDVSSHPCTVTETHEHLDDVHVHFTCKPLPHQFVDTVKKLLEIIETLK